MKRFFIFELFLLNTQVYFFIFFDANYNNISIKFYGNFPICLHKTLYTKKQTISISYNDRLIILYNTKSNDSEEITINGKEDIEKIENDIAKNAEKKSFSKFHAERPVDGGKTALQS